VRIQSRDLSEANEEFNSCEKDMQSAADAMRPSSEKLKGKQWADAIPTEQKALQYLLRAEATFRQIQVAFGQSRGGGGGGGGNAGRDLASLFDLELDTEKNQYETAQTAAPEEQHAKDVESALEKLDALAKRQEELANQHNPEQSFQQRWQQEMLRREAEQLQRQMEQLAQNNQGQQSGQQGSQGSSQQQQQGSQSSSQQQSPQGGSQSQSSASQQQGSQGGSQSQGSSSQQASSQGQSQGQSGSQAGRQQSGSQSAKQSGAGNSDQRITQALSRLRQADEMMKRNGGSQQSADAAKAAADRLREATDLLGGTQQQLASGKLDGLSREASRLSQQEHAQSEQIDKIIQDQKTSSPTDRASMMSRLQRRDQLASDRQQLSDDLSKLQKNLRDAAREMAGNQPGTAQKLRDALTQMDQSDLDNHVQRTADWLRRGIDPNSNGTENEIAQGLQKLDQQVRQAQQGMGQGDGRTAGQQRGKSSDQVAALGQVERLRSQLEGMAGAQGGNQQNGQNGRQPGGQQNGNANGQQNGNPNGQQNGNANGQQRGTNSMGRAGQGGQQNGQNGQQAGQQGTMQRGGQQGAAQRGSTQSSAQRGGANGQPGTAQAGGGNRGGDLAGQSGDVRTGGVGGANGTAWGNINTGNNSYGQASQQPVPLNASGNPADTERSFQQEMRELNTLRGMVQADPQASREVQELTQQMQKLDPSRFPGNPAMVEQMHREVLSAVDKLELQLSRDNGSNSARTGKPYVVPSGYQDSVAEYYRRLSSKQ